MNSFTRMDFLAAVLSQALHRPNLFMAIFNVQQSITFMPFSNMLLKVCSSGQLNPIDFFYFANTALTEKY